MPHRFPANARVYSRSRRQEGMILREVSPGWYEVFFSARERHRLPEHDLELLPDIDPLLDRLLNNDLDGPVEFDLANMAMRLRIAHYHDPYASLSCSRLEPQPHQIFVAHKAVQSALYPRMLLADDVGLGKTIEAGLILKELKARGLVKRTLIVAPASLVTQWERELRVKFNDKFTIMDSNRERIYQADQPDRNIWETVDQVICSIPFARDDRRADQIAAAGWDLVIFDEAHHVRRVQEGGNETRSTKAYHLAEKLRDRTRAMLLLTATPLQLQDFEFYSLLCILDPSVFPTYEAFRQHRAARAETNRLIGRVQEAHLVSPAEQIDIAHTVARHLPDLTPGDVLGHLATERGRDHIIERLAGENKLADLMVRNRKKVIGGFTTRRPVTLEVEMTPDERRVYGSMRAYLAQGYNRAQEQGDRTLGFLMVIFQRILTSSPYALVRALDRRIARLQGEEAEAGAAVPDLLEDGIDDDVESDLEASDRFEALAGHRDPETVADEISALVELRHMVQALKVDTKLQRLEAMLAQVLANPEHKVMIFTQFRETLVYLRERLQQRYRVTVFHGNMSAQEKDQATEEFRTQAQIMIATEAAGEGRNFQFCNILVNYDLPWNPMRIEQRIGRVDRIGQTRDVYIYNFALHGTVESRILEILRDRVRIFEETIGGLDPILGDVERDLTRIIMEQAPDFDRQIERIGVSLEDRIRRAREAEARMADFMMDRASFRRETLNEIENRKPTYSHVDIERFMELYFSRYTPVKRQKDGSMEVEPPGIWRQRHPDLYSREFFIGTCDPRLAIRREDLEFFAFGNAVFDAALGDCLREDFPGRATSRICRGTSQPGRRLLQCMVLLRAEGVRTFHRLVPICVDLDSAEFDEAFSVEVAHRLSEAQLGPQIDDELRVRVEAAWDDIQGWAAEYAERFRTEIRAEYEALYRQEREKQARLFRYRRIKLEQDIVENQAKIESISMRGPEEQRILYIYRHRDRDLRRELQELQQEEQRVLAELDARREVVPSFEIYSAAVVFTQ